ncbi:MAG: hypothetical protein PHR49_09735, partial [Methanoculleus sp.]|nr:hypothetical protein [Methanoculleus sp.]
MDVPGPVPGVVPDDPVRFSGNRRSPAALRGVGHMIEPKAGKSLRCCLSRALPEKSRRSGRACSEE